MTGEKGTTRTREIKIGATKVAAVRDVILVPVLSSFRRGSPFRCFAYFVGRRRADHWEPEDARRNGDVRTSQISCHPYCLMKNVQRRPRRGRSRSRTRSPSRRRSASPRASRRHRRSRTRSRSRSRSRDRDRKPAESFSRSLGGPMNADPEEAAEIAKNSKRENRVYVGNLSYDVKYRDLIEFMRGGGWGTQLLDFYLFFFVRAERAVEALVLVLKSCGGFKDGFVN